MKKSYRGAAPVLCVAQMMKRCNFGHPHTFLIRDSDEVAVSPAIECE